MGLSHELKYQADGGPGLTACFDLIRADSANPIKKMKGNLLKLIDDKDRETGD